MITDGDTVETPQNFPKGRKRRKTNKIKIPVQVNGKMRAIIEVETNLSKVDLEKIALNEKNVLKFLNGTPKKVIVVPNRIVNFVI